MGKFKLDVVTAEKMVFSDDVDEVIAEGREGQMGVLPRHAPLMTMLQPGYLVIVKGHEVDLLAITEAFIEVLGDRVIILADACDRADGYDIVEAEIAKQRAEWMIEETLKTASTLDYAEAEAALLRSLTWLDAAKIKRQKH